LETTTITVVTGSQRGVFDITAEAARFVAGKSDGLLSVFAPHATAGLAIIETGAGSEEDFTDLLDGLMPRDDARYRHRHGSPGHGADHLLPGLIAPSLVIPVVGGEMALGTWQSIVMVDPNADNPDRTVRFSFIKS
jgi:secondary thiamine-phosphate synthase enzyme